MFGFSLIGKWWRKWCEFNLHFRTDSDVISYYSHYGRELGCEIELSRKYGDARHFLRILTKLVYWEAEFARRGYKPVTIQEFIEHSRGRNLYDLRVYRDKHANFKCYAKMYQANMNSKPADQALKELINDELPDYFLTLTDDDFSVVEDEVI